MANKGNIELFSEELSEEKLLQFMEMIGGSIMVNQMNTKNFGFQNGKIYIFCSYIKKDKILHMEIGGDTIQNNMVFLKNIVEKLIANFSDIAIYASTAIIFDHFFLQKKKYLFDYIFGLEYNYVTIGFYLNNEEQCKLLLDECKFMLIENPSYQKHSECVTNERGNILKLKRIYDFSGFYLQLDLENFNEYKFIKISELVLNYSVEQISISTNYKIEKQDYDIILNGRIC